VSPASLRKKMGYVPQEHILFTGTVYENIAFAKPDAKPEEVEKAAKIASIHQDVLNFPDGYETIVGERGVALSGGQKQRISLARALITDPDVLILDDALSAVDARTEYNILKQLAENRKNKTTLIIAHRISAIESADWIIVLEQGQIAEQGDHASLMRKNGWYRHMYERQQLELW
jgi:ATP-binding cassette, subfamily B, multidrug efflux pump